MVSPKVRISAARKPRVPVANPRTSGGKELRILPDGIRGSSLLRIAFYPGCESPAVWKDKRFTSEREAQKCIDFYLRNKK